MSVLRQSHDFSADEVLSVLVRILIFVVVFAVCLGGAMWLGVTPKSWLKLLIISGVGVALATWASAGLESKIQFIASSIRESERSKPIRILTGEDFVLLSRSISHELKGPLTMLLMTLEQLDHIVENENAKRTVQAARAEAFRIRDFLEVLPRAVIPGLHDQTMDLNSLVLQAVQRMQPELETAAVKVDLELSTEPLEVKGNPPLLVQALCNLLANSIEAMRNQASERRVRISTKLQPESALIAVEDSGPGIPPHIARQIFQRVPISGGHGTGLGLNIVSEIVERHHGTIHFETKAGVGTRFSIEIPPTQKAKRPGSTRTQRKASGLKGYVLVVDDEPRMADFLSDRLEEEGFLTDKAVDLDAAWKKLHQREYDVVLLDVFMPSSVAELHSGVDLLERLMDERPDFLPKVIFLTGYPEDVLRRSRVRNAKLIKKPFTVEELLQAIPQSRR